MPDFSKRCYESEMMDDLNMEGEELASTLRQIANVNKWLGGTNVILSGIRKILKKDKHTAVLRIADFGCGGGEILRAIALWAREKGIKTELTGFDANAFTIEFAGQQSAAFPEIKFKQLDIFQMSVRENEFDITLCSLFLHHFREAEIEIILKKLYIVSSKAILINDLQRSALAFRLFSLVTFVLNASKMVRDDGLLSIRKSFKKIELIALVDTLKVKNYSIRWKWAFRYELLLHKN